MNERLLGSRYEIGKMIGTGGMADVYLAKDKRLSRDVAVKVLRSELVRDATFVSRFRKEALSAAGLNHPGIVAVYDSGEEENSSGSRTPYIVMEYVSGQTLREIIQRGERMDLERVITITRGILEALDYSHKKGIIHRDIKPGNIMITDSGDVKVMDFGIARALDESATMTNTWNVVGTAQYLAPEQATGSSADARSDLYALGCVFYELVTGRPPFTGDTPVAIAYQHVSAELPKPSTLQPSLNKAVDDFLSVALAKNPDHRYQSAATMQKDLKRLVAYSSVAHLGFIVLGTFALTNQAITGGVMQNINHGVSTGALFLMVGMIYERRHTRAIAELKGIQAVAPIFAGFFTVVMLSSIGLPGLNGFVGEFLVLIGSFETARWWVVVATVGVILAALYLLWAYQRVFHGEPDEANSSFKELTGREGLLLGVFVAIIVFTGVYPKPMLERIEPSVKSLIEHVESRTDYRQPEAAHGGEE